MHYAVTYYQPECVLALLNYNPDLHISHTGKGELGQLRLAHMLAALQA